MLKAARYLILALNNEYRHHMKELIGVLNYLCETLES